MAISCLNSQRGIDNIWLKFLIYIPYGMAVQCTDPAQFLPPRDPTIGFIHRHKLRHNLASKENRGRSQGAASSGGTSAYWMIRKPRDDTKFNNRRTPANRSPTHCT